MTPEEQRQVKKAIAVLTSLLDKENAVGQFPVWRTVTIGNRASRSIKSLSQFIEDAGMQASSWAEEILQKVKTSKEEKTLDLVKVTAEELGLTGLPTTRQIYDAAQAQGLNLCPAEVGPQLRLQYYDQPMGEWLRIGMEPLKDSDGSLRVFRVGRDGDGQWLHTGYGRPGSQWGLDSSWVFVRR